ncbi:MAG: dihydroorotate dehydrogenase-like protein [Anaerolineae bacterium]|nr:dihydroorotate dehydrogenase-like protein [Anaerolineae bacterium]
MDITTTYLGLNLRSPLVVSASPLSEKIENIQRMQDAGAGAVVLYSLFEEQIEREQLELQHHLTFGTESFPEALTYFPEPPSFKLGPEEYLNHIRRVKGSVDIPVIASLNGSSIGGWTGFARDMQQAGADALELNIYYIPTDPNLTAEAVEQTYVRIVTAVKEAVTIPVAIKLGPYFSSLANMAKRLDEAGADGLVLFNRFYQPDFDLDEMEVRPNVLLSTPQASRLPLRWIAILYGTIKADMAATSGIHTGKDAVKMLLAGANVTMMASALLSRGIEHLKTVEAELREWMAEKEYDSVEQMRGAMSQKNVAQPSAFERAQYMRALTTYDPAAARARDSQSKLWGE